MRYGTLIMLLSFFITLSAQQHNNYTFRHIDQTDGLLHNSVLSVGQDAKGYIWILTANGLQRYDGTRFINYQDIVNSPSSGFTNGAELYIDKDKNLAWVLKENIMEKLELSTNRFTLYDEEQLLKDPAFKFDTYTDEKNNRFLLGSKGAFRYDDSAKKFLSLYLNIYPARVNKSLWMVTDSIHQQTWVTLWNEMLLFDGKTRKIYSTNYNPIDDPLLQQLHNLKSRSFRIIQQDSRHNLWIGSWSDAVYQYNTETNKLSTYSLSSIKKKKAGKKNMDGILISSCVYEDNHHTIWICTDNAGLLRYNREKDDFDFILSDENNKQSIQYNYRIFTIFQDREDNIWLGTDNGISVFNPYRQYFQSIHNEEANIASLPKNEITCFIQTGNGDILAGTWGGGITVYDAKWQFKKTLRFQGTYETNLVWCFLQNDDGTIWVGCQHGYIHIYHPDTKAIQTIHPPELNNSTIRCMAKDKKGNIWLGLHNGKIAKWGKTEKRFYPWYDSSANNELPLAPVHYIFIDHEQRCWVSTESGFKQFDLSKRSFTATWLPHKNDLHSITGINCNGIEEYDDSTLFIGTIYGGLNIFDINRKTFSHLTTSNGSPSNTIYALKKDTAGYVWFTTDYDLYKFKPAEKNFIRFNIEPGTINSAFKSSEFYSLPDGRWLTATETEIICFHPQNILPANNKTKVEITGFKIFDSALFIDSIPDSKKVIQLSYRQNFLTIEFSALSFSNLQHTKYYYLLSNVDNDWVVTDTKTFASYTNLQPGEYNFSVKTENDNGISEPTSITIIITPPFWQTRWFILIILSCALLIIYLFVRWREKNIKAIETEKLKVQQLSAEQYKSKLELERIINYFSSSLIDKNTGEEVLWDVAKNLIGRLGFVDCMIYLWNSDKTKMIQKAGFGPKGSIEEINEQPFDVLPGQGVVGYVMQTREPLLIPDTSKDSRYRPDEMERLSEITVPVIYNNELIGVIDSEHHEKNFYTSQHLQILSTIATLMANKIKSIEAEQLLQRTQIEMYSMNEQLSKAKLEALRAQMNPHFIFNCLTSIDNLIQMDEKEKATLYLSKFAKLIRSILENATNNTVPCWKDIETLKLYLELEALRFDNKFLYRLIIADEILNGDYKVPPLVIQPFVENAIHHGLLNKIEGDKQLTIRVSVVRNLIHYLIEDNGVGRAKANAYKQLNRPSHQSMGMQITTDRINLFNQNNNGCVVITDMFNEMQEPCGTKVIIELINQS
ncbi:MAG: two-component regulator propeller domain-containing protein [Ferruginibacter sp.]